MANSEVTAKRWMRWLLTRDEIPFRSALSHYFADPKLARLCDRGCNSFDLELADGTELPVVCAPGRYGMFFELNYELPENRVLEFLFFGDKSGRLAGIDIEVSGNNFPVPDEPRTGELVHVWSPQSNVP